MGRLSAEEEEEEEEEELLRRPRSAAPLPAVRGSPAGHPLRRGAVRGSATECKGRPVSRAGSDRPDGPRGAQRCAHPPRDVPTPPSDGREAENATGSFSAWIFVSLCDLFLWFFFIFVFLFVCLVGFFPPFATVL